MGESLALLADQMFFIVLAVLVLRVAGAGAALGAVLAVAAVPGAVLMLFGGWTSDRFGAATVLVVSNAGRAALMAVLASLVLADATRLWHLYALAGALGVLDAFHYPASLSVVPSVVEDKELGAANSLIHGAEQVGGIVGPALAAAAATTVGLGTSFGVFALMFLVTSAAALSVARGVARRRRSLDAASAKSERRAASVSEHSPAELSPPGETTILGGIVEGVRYAWGDPLIRAILLILAATNLAAIGTVIVGGAALAEARLGGAASLGILFSAFGGGSLVGLLVAGSVGAPRRRGATMLLVTALFGVGFVALGLAPEIISASAISAVMGVGSGYLDVVLISWLQERIEPDLQGRVMSLMVFCAVALEPVSYALAGTLLTAGPAIPFAAAGALLLAAALLGGLSPTVRRFD